MAISSYRGSLQQSVTLHRRKVIRIASALLLCTGLYACSNGGDSSSTNTNTQASGNQQPPVIVTGETRTALGRRGALSEEVATDLSNADAQWQDYNRDIEYQDYKTYPLHYIPLRNGKHLAVRVSVPIHSNGAATGRQFPAVVSQTAYNTNLISLMAPEGGSVLSAPDPFFVQRGYAMVGIDVVGSGASEGGWEMIGEEEQAAYSQAIDWVAKQPWCNGKIGVAGVSYMGITSLLTAAQQHPAIQAVFTIVPMGDAMRSVVGTGGLINGVFMSHWLTLTQVLTTQTEIPELLFHEHHEILEHAQQDHIDQIDEYYLPIIDDALNGADHIAYDNEFWAIRSPIEQVDNIQVPTFIIGSLHDLFQRDEPLLYERLKRNVDTKLIIYDGDHAGSSGKALAGDAEIPPATNLMLQWFDHYLRDMNTGVAQQPNVTQFVKNYPGKYITTTDWPHPALQPQRWYLHGDMSIDQQAPADVEASHEMYPPQHAEIEAGKSEDGRYLEFNVEPKDGSKCSISYVQWTLGIGGLTSLDPCLRDNGQVEANALNYETAPLTEDLYLNGPVVADIWIESTTPDAVVSVRLDEVSPSGNRVRPISNGLLLASMRAVDDSRSRFINDERMQPWHIFTKESQQLLNSGEVVHLPIEIFATSAIIRKGHRLRISVSASNQAQGVLNNTQKANTSGGVTTIHHSADYPSSILLPTVPTSSLN